MYFKDAFWNPAPYIIPWISALPMQVRGYPPQWKGFSGYARRAGSRYLGELAAKSVANPMMALLKHDPRYPPCRCEGAWKRLGHAVLFNYITLNDDGKRVFHVSRFAAVYVGELTAQSVIPGGYDGWRAVRRANGALFFGWWLNVLREFRPEIVSLFGRN